MVIFSSACLLALASLLSALLFSWCLFGTGKSGTKKVPTLRTSVFGAAIICWDKGVMGKGAALKRDGLVEILQGSGASLWWGSLM